MICTILNTVIHGLLDNAAALALIAIPGPLDLYLFAALVRRIRRGKSVDVGCPEAVRAACAD